MPRRVRVADTSAKIFAIKQVREITGLGLKDSLDLVEGKAWFSVDRDDATLLRVADEGRAAGVRFEFDPPLDASAPAAASTSSGWAVRFWAVRFRYAPNEIEAIELVRELTAVGLARAKDFVEREQQFCVAHSPAELERVLEAFARIRARVEVEQVEGGVASELPTPNVSGSPSRSSPKPSSDKRVYGRAADDDDF